ncbi:hypothetical protein DICVIV_02227 [Dictyocaulus viviparus]|uniref:FHA domain-containing protein n=1 Tax=Dictyocaulus viviparus TaxID=29172 RepID=A0A0D8Y6H2_DICVI|nr:hypothetical protein DICVIV_02227 [Dictyocaulus viviparus]
MPLELSQKSLDDTVSCFTTCDFIRPLEKTPVLISKFALMNENCCNRFSAPIQLTTLFHFRQLSCNGGDAHNRDSQPDSGDGEDQNHTRQIKQEIEDDVTSAGQDFFGKNYGIEKKVKHETDLDDASSTEFESNLKDRWCVSTRFGFGKNDDISVEEKEKVNLGVSGKLADDTNIFRGVLMKYNEPLKAKKPIFRLRLYPFKNNESLSVSHIHRESVCLIATVRKIADLPISHPICSTQHPVFQYRSIPFERIYGTEPRLVPPYTIHLSSSNGTFLNGSKNEPQRHVKLVNKDVLKSEFSRQEFVMFNKKLADGVNASDSQPYSPASD